jgi:plasmid maintenance system antidote protein VapI
VNSATLPPLKHKAAIVNSPSANSSTVYSAPKYIDPITEAERIVNEMKENEEKVIDTFKVSNMMKTELRKAGISLMNFAKVVKINRNYLSSLINKPLEYEKASKLQKQVYQSMYHWLNHKSKRTVPFTETARPALQTLNISTGDSMQDSAQLKKIQPRQPRVTFTNAQRDYLNKCFECDPKPSQEQKVEMSKMLGLDLRTIVFDFV